MTMLAEYGTMSLAQVLAPAIEMADGYPMEAELVNIIEHYKDIIKQWPDSKRVMLVIRQRLTKRRSRRDLPPAGSGRDAAQAGRGRRGHSPPARIARPPSTPPTSAFYRGDIAHDLGGCRARARRSVHRRGSRQLER